MKKFDLYFTSKRKMIISVICLGIMLIWAVLRYFFSYEFYSLFYSWNVGSNILLLGLELVLIFPMNFIFSKYLKANISVFFTLISDILFLTATGYVYSIFRYKYVWTVILCVGLHFISKIFITGNCYEGEKTVLSLLKRNPFKTILVSLIQTVLTDGIFLLLMTVIARVMADT